MLRPQTVSFTLLLGALTGISPFSTSMYIPSLPDIARSLEATPAEVQLTISAFLFGLAFGQVVHGPVSDRYGRKPVLVAALAVFCVTSLICAAAWSVQVLFFARAIQAISGASGIVISRAMIRDVHDGVQAARVLSLVGSVMALAPVVGPLVGGVLQDMFGWRAGFFVLAALGLVLLAIVSLNLAETIKHRASEPLSIAGTLKIFAGLLRNRAYVAYIGMAAASFGGSYAWFSGSSFILQDLYHLSPVGFALVYGVNSAGFLVGTALAARLVLRKGINFTIGLGACLLLVSGFAFLAILALGFASLSALIVVMTFFLAGMGLVMPQAFAGALTLIAKNAGAASSLAGALQQVTGGVSAAAVGFFLGRSAWPVAWVVAIMGCVVFGLWLYTGKLRALATAAANGNHA
jgi:DHA1 family bicyclomycin/chloramphenicol resistance-like MFS transporter